MFAYVNILYTYISMCTYCVYMCECVCIYTHICLCLWEFESLISPSSIIQIYRGGIYFYQIYLQILYGFFDVTLNSILKILKSCIFVDETVEFCVLAYSCYHDKFTCFQQFTGVYIPQFFCFLIFCFVQSMSSANKYSFTAYNSLSYPFYWLSPLLPCCTEGVRTNILDFPRSQGEASFFHH